MDRWNCEREVRECIEYGHLCTPPKLPVDFREALQRHGRAVERRQQIPADIADRAGGPPHAQQHILNMFAGEPLELFLDCFGRVLLSAHADRFLP